MDGNSTATNTARRNLVQRIERMLARLEKETREPTGSEGRALWQAIDRLAIAQYPDGEDAMMFAEKDWKSQRILIEGEPTLQDLRARFDDVLNGSG